MFRNQRGQWSVAQTGQIPRVANCTKPQAVGTTLLAGSGATYVVGRVEKSAKVSSLSYGVGGKHFSAQFVNDGFFVVRLGKTVAMPPETITLHGASNRPLPACVQF